MKWMYCSICCLLVFTCHAQSIIDSAILKDVYKLLPDSVYKGISFSLQAKHPDSPAYRTGEISTRQLLLRKLQKKHIFPTADALTVMLEYNTDLIGKDSVSHSYRVKVPTLPRLRGPARRLRRAEYRYYSKPDTLLSSDFWHLAESYTARCYALSDSWRTKASDSLRMVLESGGSTAKGISRFQLMVMDDQLAWIVSAMNNMVGTQFRRQEQEDSLVAATRSMQQFFTIVRWPATPTTSFHHRARISATSAAAGSDPSENVPNDGMGTPFERYEVKKLSLLKVNFYVSEGGRDPVQGMYYIRYGPDSTKSLTQAYDPASTAGAVLLEGKYYFEILGRVHRDRKYFEGMDTGPIPTTHFDKETGLIGWVTRLVSDQPVYKQIFRVMANRSGR